MEVVSVPGGYDAVVLPDGLTRAGVLLRPRLKANRVLLCADETVARLYAERVERSLTGAGFEVARAVFPAGEASKRLSTVEQLCGAAADAGLTRGDAFIALGGGVTGDLTGFAASMYLRGADWAVLPTSLLSMTDSAVGGKTAVDLDAGKNLAGAFWNPRAVICDPTALQTLPASEYACGMAEAIKTGLLFDEELFLLLEGGVESADTRLPAVITACLRYKADAVGGDERDFGKRRLLNLGHTAAHAIERLSGYRISHGQAVAIGLCVTARASERRGWCRDVSEPLETALGRYGLPVRCPYSAAELAEAAIHDKKREHKDITLAIPERVGKACLRTIPLDGLRGFFTEGI